MIKIEDLKYPTDALEEAIDAQTMEIHHDRHHQTYADNVNNLLKGTDMENMTALEVLKNIDKVPSDKKQGVINNAGGVYNHDLFFEQFKKGGASLTNVELSSAINDAFGSFSEMKEQMKQACLTRFGSGWGWLVVTEDKSLKIMSTANQDSPILEGHTPIFGIDVWEHAYYLRYQNKRPDYVDAIWSVVDWDVIADRYTEAKGA